jgi:hypothetical protein
MILMTFDEDQEELIELTDLSIFIFFVSIFYFLVFKYSMHFFAFLEASVVEGRTVAFITKQFFKDFSNMFSYILRLYILLFRLNVYDTLDDFFDSYSIFLTDFDEETIFDDLFIFFQDKLHFSNNNDGDNSLNYNVKTSLISDLYSLFFIV